MFRPEGWINPFRSLVRETHDIETCWCPNCGSYKDYERGADALLEALRKEGKHYGEWGISHRNCTIVTIPDESTGGK